MMRFPLRVLLAVAATALTAAPGACDQVLWQLGRPDNDYSEFAIARDYAGYTRLVGSGVRCVIGAGEPEKSWPFIQPGPVDAWAGSKRHPQVIEFAMESQPEGVYALRIDLVDAHSSAPPTVEVRVNDRAGVFRLRPGVSDASLTNPSNGREQVITMYIRGEALRRGRNTVTITASQGSWMLYDCISFTRCEQPPKPVENLEVRPTVFFRKHNGKLLQVVELSMDLIEGSGVVRAELSSDDGTRTAQTFRDVPAGHVSLQMEVPEATQPRKVRATVRAGGETAEAEGSVLPQKKWRIYLMPSTHLDIGYTGLQTETMQVHRENLDRAIHWCEKYPGFIWDLEGSLVFEDYLAKGGDPARLWDLARRGRIGVMGFYGNELTGICSSEGLTRLVDYYDWLRKEHEIESRCAMMTDVPTMVGTVPMILAGHGIKYLSHGVNATRARGDQELYNTPYYWESPDGSRVLTWRVPGYGYACQITGTGPDTSIESAEEKVNAILAGYNRRADYPFDAILMHGGYGDNQPNVESLARIPEGWNRKYEYPKIIFTRGPEFFEYIEANFADQIRTMKGDQGVWWEDGAASSAYETGVTRVAKEQLVTAEKLIALCGAHFRRTIAPDLADAWRNILYYDEHTWGAAQSISEPDCKTTRRQWAIKRAFAVDACTQVRQILSKSVQEFGKEFDSSSGVVVFNPSSWPRTEWVIYKDRIGLEKQVLAKDVPPMGWKLLANPPKVIEPAEQPGDTLENAFYAVRFDKTTGAVASIYDKELKRELVDASKYGPNQYLYVSGGENGRVMNCDLGQPIADLKKQICSGAVLKKLSLPGRQVMRITASAPMCAGFACDVTLYDDIKRIDFSNILDKYPSTAKEAVYFAFPFAFTKPDVRIEIPDGVIRADTDQVKAACRDWYCAQHFVTVSDDSAAIAWSAIDAPLFTLQDIFRGQWYDRLPVENGSIFAYAMNNYWFTNYKASQQGKMTFRFSITSAAKMSDIDAKRFGESVQQPMVAVPLSVSPDPASRSHSYVSVDTDNVVVQAMSPARFADGTMIRLREMEGRTTNVRLSVNGIGFRAAYLCNLAEDRLAKLDTKSGVVEVPCRALGLTTVVLER